MKNFVTAGLTALAVAAVWTLSSASAFAQCEEAKKKGDDCEKAIGAHKGECKACKAGKPCDLPAKKSKIHDDWKKEHKHRCGDCRTDDCDVWHQEKGDHDDACEKERQKHHDGCKACRAEKECPAWRKKKEEHARRCAELRKKHAHGCAQCGGGGKDGSPDGDRCDHWKEKQKSHDARCEEMKKKHSGECHACSSGKDCDAWRKKKEYLDKECQKSRDEHDKNCDKCSGGHGTRSKDGKPGGDKGAPGKK